MRGEVKGGDRPENSLLGLSVDVERSSKPAPLISQAYTSTLEDMIRKRIVDDTFDDVEVSHITYACIPYTQHTYNHTNHIYTNHIHTNYIHTNLIRVGASVTSSK